MFMRPAKVLVVIMLAATLGMHWALLQTIAWSAMLADNLQSASFREAMIKTFDGEHPCCLCKAVKAGRNSENKKEFTLATFQPEFPLSGENPTLIAPSEFQLYPQKDFFATVMSLPPPTPPPRGFFV